MTRSSGACLEISSVNDQLGVQRVQMHDGKPELFADLHTEIDLRELMCSNQEGPPGSNRSVTWSLVCHIQLIVFVKSKENEDIRG